MTKQEWIGEVSKDKHKYRDIIASFHPNTVSRSEASVVITAGAAERACERIRQEIRKRNTPMNPVDVFDLALAAGDAEMLSILMNEAWFGMPEDRELALRTPGFMIMCDLLSDMWDDA